MSNGRETSDSIADIITAATGIPPMLPDFLDDYFRSLLLSLAAVPIPPPL
jgi:hypothetical protein